MRTILTLLLFVLAMHSLAQTPDTIDVIKEQVEPCSDPFLENKTAYLKNYLTTHGYPDSSDNMRIKVYVAFYIDSLGNVEQPKVKRGYNAKFDMAAIDIVKNMPRWTPMICNGVPKRTRVILPIIFQLH